jgi:hypothetical protein
VSQVPTITVRMVTLNNRDTAYVADGPDGHTWLLSRYSEEAAKRDGLEYLLRTRKLENGRWVLS